MSTVSKVRANTGILYDIEDTVAREVADRSLELINERVEEIDDLLENANKIVEIGETPSSEYTQVLVDPDVEEIDIAGGLTEEVKQALLNCFAHVAWRGNDGRTYYNELESVLYPPVNITGISVVYTQSGTVRATDSLDSLKTDLVVTAHYDDQSTATVNDYALFGTLVEGTTSTITVSYRGKTATFDVVVYAPIEVTVATEGNNLTLNESASIGTSYEGCKRTNNYRFRTVNPVAVNVGNVITWSAENISSDTLGAYFLWFDSNGNYTGQHSSDWNYSGSYTVDQSYPYIGIAFRTQSVMSRITEAVLTVKVQGG